MIHFKERTYGFEYGCANVSRICSDDKKQWILLGVETPKHKKNGGIQIYVTKTGKVRVFDERGEWSPPEKK